MGGSVSCVMHQRLTFAKIHKIAIVFLMNAEKSGQRLTLCRVPSIVRFIKLYLRSRIATLLKGLKAFTEVLLWFWLLPH